MKLRKFWAVWVRAGGTPSKSATGLDPILQIGSQISGIISAERPKRDHEEACKRDNTYQSIRPKSLRMQQPVDHPVEALHRGVPGASATLEAAHPFIYPDPGAPTPWPIRPMDVRWSLSASIRTLQSVSPYPGWKQTGSVGSATGRCYRHHHLRRHHHHPAAAAPPSPPPLCRRAPLPGNVHRMSPRKRLRQHRNVRIRIR